jgi:hypothetical protein
MQIRFCLLLPILKSPDQKGLFMQNLVAGIKMRFLGGFL